MATMDSRRIVKHWEDWKHFHLEAYKFQLCRYDSRGQESYRTNIAAKNDDKAIKQCGAIVKNLDRKKG